MFWGSHISLPLIGVKIYEIHQAKKDKAFKITRRQYFIVAISSIIPDLINPHVYLNERLNSISHTLWMLLAIMIGTSLLKYFKWISGTTLVLINLAILSHLILDAIAGGIKIIYPLSGQKIGDYIIQVKYWVVLDVVSIIICLLIFNIHANRKRYVAQQGVAPEPVTHQ